jgi:hypothetical protein
MSKSAFQCRACHYMLGYHHHGGTLHVANGVPARIDLRRNAVRSVSITCPQCEAKRVYIDGTILFAGEGARGYQRQNERDGLAS